MIPATCPTCLKWPTTWMAYPADPKRAPHPMCDTCKAQAIRYHSQDRFEPIERQPIARPR